MWIWIECNLFLIEATFSIQLRVSLGSKQTNQRWKSYYDLIKRWIIKLWSFGSSFHLFSNVPFYVNTKNFETLNPNIFFFLNGVELRGKLLSLVLYIFAHIVSNISQIITWWIRATRHTCLVPAPLCYASHACVHLQHHRRTQNDVKKFAWDPEARALACTQRCLWGQTDAIQWRTTYMCEYMPIINNLSHAGEI